MEQRKETVTDRLYLRYIYTVSKVGYIHIESVIPVMFTRKNAQGKVHESSNYLCIGSP